MKNKNYLFHCLAITILFCFFNTNIHAQSNDCTTAPPLTVSTTGCVSTPSTNVGSTFGNAASGGAPICANGGAAEDVWYRFVASNATTTIETEAGAVGTIGDTGIQLYSTIDGTCNNLVSIECNDDGGTGLYSRIARNDLVIGQTYYVRIWRYSGGTGTFGICITSPAPVIPLANDECTGAITLPVGQFECTFTSATNVNATYSGVVGTNPPSAACGGNGVNIRDIWYKFIAPAGGQAAIDTQLGSLTNAAMELYRSTDGTCATLTYVACNDNVTSPADNMPTLTAYNLVPGNTYYIRVWGNGNNTGTFDICVQNQYSDCDVAFPLCSSSAFNTNAFGPGNQDDVIGSCFTTFSENQSIWLNFEIQTSGSFGFIIDSQNTAIKADGDEGDDYDFILYRADNTNFCSNYLANGTVRSCNARSSRGPNGTTGISTADGGATNSEGSNVGNPFNLDLNVTAGERYYLLIDNFNNTGIGFDLAFTGTASLDCTLLPLEMTEFGGEKVKDQNLLHWATAREYNTSHFEIERSNDAMDFIKIGELKSGNKKLENQIYQYWDAEPQTGINYYRLKQVDLDGTFTYTKTITIDNQGIIKNFELQKIYPNPAQNSINFVFAIPISNSEIQLEIFDSNGKSVSNNTESYEKGIQNFNQNLSSFSKGLYILRILNLQTGQVLTEKFIKE